MVFPVLAILTFKIITEACTYCSAKFYSPGRYYTMSYPRNVRQSDCREWEAASQGDFCRRPSLISLWNFSGTPQWKLYWGLREVPLCHSGSLCWRRPQDSHYEINERNFNLSFFLGRLGRYWTMHPTALLPLGGTEPITGTQAQLVLQTCTSTHLLCFSFVIKQSNCCVYLDCAGSRPDDGWPSEASGCERRKHTQRADLTHSTIYNEHNIGCACVLFRLFACLFSEFNFRIHIIHFVMAELCSVSLSPTLRVPATQFSLHSVPNNKSSHPLMEATSLTWVLPFFHLWQTVLITFDPADIVSPTCEAKTSSTGEARGPLHCSHWPDFNTSNQSQ